MRKGILIALLLLMVPAFASAQLSQEGLPQKFITTADITGVTHWSSDTVYVLTELVYIEAGNSLIIEPGTIIKGQPGTAANAKALIVARGGKIYAMGTPAQPIIFTSTSDNVLDPDDIPLCDDAGRGLWGGVVILGKAVVNTSTPTTNHIEGIDPLETRAEYGGNDDNDNSGIFEYVSIRHGGTVLEEASEINGLTMGGVGRGTKISHVEVFMNLDDGYEWFGGTVSPDHLVAAFCGDDSFDYDEGFRGCGQFWFSIMCEDAGERGGEHDGGTTPVDGIPYASPLISNVTYLGRGVAGVPGNQCFEIRDNAAGAYYNSIFTDHADVGFNEVEVVDPLVEPTDSEDRMLEGSLYFYNNIWFGFGAGNTPTAICNGSAVAEANVFTNGHDFIFDPGIAGITRTPDGTLDPRPTSLGGWTRGWIDPLDPVDGYDPESINPTTFDVEWPPFVQVDYPGAFDPNGDLWICHWTALDQYGFLASGCSAGVCSRTTQINKYGAQKPEVAISSASITSGTNVWTNDNVYVLQELVYVESGETVIIEPGTIIKGLPGTAANAKAFIIARGGKCYAIGGSDTPVIFTSSSDDVDDPGDLPLCDDAGRGLWGGVVILGKAVVNTSTPTTNHIEGIDPLEPRAEYGGTDDDDNSGVYKYMSVRHGGTVLEEASEINGVTMGAVGRGTVMSHIEVFMNLDDGYEWFGGTVSPDHLIAAFCGDDSFDYDEGFRGCGQFWFTIMCEDAGERGGEHDGGTTPVDGVPYASPLISNATYLGRGIAGVPGNQALEIRDNAAGAYYNSIFTDHADVGFNEVEVVDPLVEPTDSEDRMLEGSLYFYNNIWFGFGAGNTPTAICNGSAVAEANVFTNGHDFIFDPGIASIDRTPSNLLDPRPTTLAGWTRGWIDPMGVDGYDPESIGGGGGCCVGTTGDANCMGGDIPTVADISTIIDFLFISGTPLCCVAEADANRSGTDENPPLGTEDITVSDISFIIDALFISGTPLPACPNSSPFDVEWKPFVAVDYPGAFDPNADFGDLWLVGWTALDCDGYLGAAF